MPYYRPCAACLRRINSYTIKANQNLHIPWTTRCTQWSLDTKCCCSRVFALPTNMHEHARGSAVARQYRHHSLRATPSERSSAKAPTLYCTTAVHAAAACVLVEALRHTQKQARPAQPRQKYLEAYQHGRAAGALSSSASSAAAQACRRTTHPARHSKTHPSPAI